MSYDNWQDVLTALQRTYLDPANDDQKRLAKKLGIQLNENLPARIAAEKIKLALAPALLLENAPRPSPGQLTFLSDLKEELQVSIPDPVSSSEASAWLDVLTAQRALAALRTLRLRRGDVVKRISAEEDETEVVSSIGADGYVYLGRGGGRVRPEYLTVVVRADDMSGEGQAGRVAAKARLVRRERRSGTPSVAKLGPLAQYRVRGLGEHSDARRLEEVLETSEDERPLQALLAQSPQILGGLVRSTYGTFVIPLPRLGRDYVPDFAIAAADSAGIHWTVVELESPRANLSTREGRPSARLRSALDQIRDWRDWLDANIDQARRLREAHGLGLPDIAPDAAGLVLIGRTGLYPPKFNAFRKRTQVEQRTTIHTYSWLVDVVRSEKHPLFGPLESSNSW